MEGKQVEIDDPSLGVWSNKAAATDTLTFKDNSLGVQSYSKVKPRPPPVTGPLSEPFHKLSLLQTGTSTTGATWFASKTKCIRGSGSWICPRCTSSRYYTISL